MDTLAAHANSYGIFKKEESAGDIATPEQK